MITPPELEHKAKLSISFLVALVITAFSLGGTITTLILQVGKIDHIENEIEQSKKEAMEYTTQEVGGLRSDWERDRADQNKDIDNLQKHHIKE